MPNATLIVEFPKNTYRFPVTWIGDRIEESSDIANEVFVDREYHLDFMDGPPDMDVVLDADPSIKSRVLFEDMAWEIYPTRPNPRN